MKINVLVTGVGGGGVGEQIMKCLRLSTLDINIIGCDMSKSSMGLKEADKGYIVPPASSVDYIDCVLGICKKNDIKMIFHGSEPELLKFSKNRSVFENENIIIPLNSEKVIDICMDKNATMDFLRDNKLGNFQRYWEISSINDIDKVNIYPVVLKPSVGGGGSANTFISQDKEELYLFSRYLLGIYDKFLVQEYVGNPHSEYTVGVYCSRQGKYINSIAVKKSILSGLSNKVKIKNRTGREELGELLAISSGVSQGEIGRFPEVTVVSSKIATQLGSTAALNIQCRIHQGKVYVFEINPRISGTSSLRAIAGYNEPDMLIRERLLGEELKVDFPYREGMITRGLCEKFISNDFMESLEFANRG